MSTTATTLGDKNPYDDLDPEAVVKEAIKRASSLMTLREYNTLEAEETLAMAVASLETRSMASQPVEGGEQPAEGDQAELQKATEAQEHDVPVLLGGRHGQCLQDDKKTKAAKAEECLKQLREADVYKTVNERVAQFDSATEILYNENMTNLYECEYGKFDLCVSPDGRWFDYRMTVDIDAPLSEALSTGHEMEYVPQAQPLVNDAEFIGEYSGFNLKFIMRLAVLIFKSELVIEIVRHRDKRFGYVLEVARSEFPHEGVAGMPKKAWGAIRPWIYTTNLWLPRGDGKEGCTIVQVTRVDCTVSVPSWVLNFVFKKMSTTFINDLRSSALKALNPDSPWAKKIKEDKHGFYEELRKIEEVARARREVRVKTVPDSDIFDRPWRLMPDLLDTRPPCSR